MTSFHYPCRWKYDCFRALEYFLQIGHPYDSRMQDALNLVKDALKKVTSTEEKAIQEKFISRLNPAQKEDLTHTEACSS